MVQFCGAIFENLLCRYGKTNLNVVIEESEQAVFIQTSLSKSFQILQHKIGPCRTFVLEYTNVVVLY